MEVTECENMPFRVSICLKEYFSDERARCYLLVNGKSTVSWLHSRLRRLFPLPATFCLQVNGHLLPPDEPLALLRPDDRVIAMPTRNRECYPAEEDDHSDAKHSNGHESYKGRETADRHGAAPGAAARPDGDAGALREAKRRALAELDACEPPARRVRRRVRRRRPRPADGGSLGDTTDPPEPAGGGAAPAGDSADEVPPSARESPLPPWPPSPHRAPGAAPRGPPRRMPSPGCRSRHRARPPSPEVFVRHRGHVLQYPGLRTSPPPAAPPAAPAAAQDAD